MKHVRNNIKNISLLGIGTSEAVRMNTKYIIRTALMTTSDRVILVHNHPSNGLEPSDLDKHITNFTSKLLEIYNIKLLDHIIVAENNYVSMNSINAIDRKYEDDKTKTIDKVLLIEENEKLKEEIYNYDYVFFIENDTYFESNYKDLFVLDHRLPG